MRFYSLNKPRKCPRCKSARVVPIVYGYPNYEAHLEELAGKIVLGGCCRNESGIDPRWECLDCEAKIFREKIFQ